MRSCENDGIEMIAPHRSNPASRPTQDRRRLSALQAAAGSSKRFFAWVQWQRRIARPRGSTTLRNFLGFVQLACLVVALQTILR